LCAVVAAQVGLYGLSFVRTQRLLKSAQDGFVSHTSTTTGRTPVHTEDDGAQFHDLPPEQKVARSTAIVLVSYQKDGEKFKAVVAEILKKNPDTELYYAVGDEMPTLSYYGKDGEMQGEGQVVFMQGSPARMRSSYSFEAGRIGGLGDMPLDVLRKMVKDLKR
jgi:hypothetical protein